MNDLCLYPGTPWIMCEGSSVCILVLLGIPGTGKSTFSALFKNYAEPRNLNVVHVCYDKLVPLGRYFINVK